MRKGVERAFALSVEPLALALAGQIFSSNTWFQVEKAYPSNTTHGVVELNAAMIKIHGCCVTAWVNVDASSALQTKRPAGVSS